MREHVYPRDAALPNVDPEDGRNIEIVATGLCAACGVPLAVDATLLSPVHSEGTPLPHADSSPGVALSRAESTKARTYPELVYTSLLRLWTVARETGGRLKGQGTQLLTEAAHTRARSEPSVLRRTAARNWRTRWTTLLWVAVQDSLAATLVNDGAGLLDAAQSRAPTSVEVWLSAAAGASAAPTPLACPGPETT